VKDKDALRITDQHRGKHGMVYDLKREDVRLSLTMAQKALDGAVEWEIEARAGRAPEALVVAGRGATRRDALLRVGESWAREATEHRLPPFDWEEVARALDAVRAL